MKDATQMLTQIRHIVGDSSFEGSIAFWFTALIMIQFSLYMTLPSPNNFHCDLSCTLAVKFRLKSKDP